MPLEMRHSGPSGTWSPAVLCESCGQTIDAQHPGSWGTLDNADGHPQTLPLLFVHHDCQGRYEALRSPYRFHARSLADLAGLLR